MSETQTTSEHILTSESPFVHSLSESLIYFLNRRSDSLLPSIDPTAYINGEMTINDVMDQLENSFPGNPDNQYVQYALLYAKQEDPLSHAKDIRDRMPLLGSMRARVAQLESEGDIYRSHRMEIPRDLQGNITSYQDCIQMLTKLKPQNTVHVLTKDDNWFPMLKEEYDSWIDEGGRPPISVED